MADNPYRVGKTQWAKWNDAGRVAYNEARDAGASYGEAVSAANTATIEAEESRKAKKRGLLDTIGDVVAAVGSIATTAAPIIAVAKTVARTRTKKGK